MHLLIEKMIPFPFGISHIPRWINKTRIRQLNGCQLSHSTLWMRSNGQICRIDISLCPLVPEGTVTPSRAMIIPNVHARKLLCYEPNVVPPRLDISRVARWDGCYHPMSFFLKYSNVAWGRHFVQISPSCSAVSIFKSSIPRAIICSRNQCVFIA